MGNPNNSPFKGNPEVAKEAGKKLWKKLFTNYTLNSQFMQCQYCEAEKCPHRDKAEIEGGDKVCFIEQQEFYLMRKLYTRDYELTASDLVALDLMLHSIIRLRRIQRYLRGKFMEAKVPNFNPKTGETVYSKQMRLINQHIEKIERGVREWMHSNRFARKEKHSKPKKKDYAMALNQ